MGRNVGFNHYHLTYSFYRWYLVARKPKEGVFRTYALARMEDVEVLRQAFARRKTFQIDDYLKGSFGIITSDALHDVVVDFAPSKAALIRERIWHPSQELEELKDGGVRLTMKLSSLDEVADWILGWREQARVVSPKVLRQKIGQAAQAILELYGNSSCTERCFDAD